MKLQVGDIIEVIGWVLLEKLESGKRYKIARIRTYGNLNVYVFTKPKGKKEIVGHYSEDVDLWIGRASNNRIKIVK